MFKEWAINIKIINVFIRKKHIVENIKIERCVQGRPRRLMIPPLATRGKAGWDCETIIVFRLFWKADADAAADVVPEELADAAGCVWCSAWSRASAFRAAKLSKERRRSLCLVSLRLDIWRTVISSFEASIILLRNSISVLRRICLEFQIEIKMIHENENNFDLSILCWKIKLFKKYFVFLMYGLDADKFFQLAVVPFVKLLTIIFLILLSDEIIWIQSMKLMKTLRKCIIIKQIFPFRNDFQINTCSSMMGHSEREGPPSMRSPNLPHSSTWPPSGPKIPSMLFCYSNTKNYFQIVIFKFEIEIRRKNN